MLEALILGIGNMRACNIMFFYSSFSKSWGEKNTFDSFLLFTTAEVAPPPNTHTHTHTHTHTTKVESVLTVAMTGKHLWHLVGRGQGYYTSYSAWDSLAQETVPSPTQLSNVPINI